MCRVKALKPHRSSNKPEADTRYIAELEATGSFAVKKPKSIRVLKFGRCYIDFGWSPARASAAAELSASEGREFQAHRTSVESSVELSAAAPDRTELPTQSDKDSVIELAGDRAQEPPAELPTMSTFEHDAIYELESPIDGGFGQFSNNFEEHHFGMTYSDSSKWEAPPVQRMVRQALPRLTTQAPSPGFQFEDHIDASPYLSSANSSLTPSPVSPVTPNLGTTSHPQSQDWSIVSPISARPSSCQSFSHFMQQYVPQYPHQRNAFSEPASFTSTPVEGSLYTMAGSWNMEFGQSSHFSTAPATTQEESTPYQHSEHELQMPAVPSLNMETSWDDVDFFTTNNDHIEDDSLWYPTSFDVESIQPEHNTTEDVSTSLGEEQGAACSSHDPADEAFLDEDIVRRKREEIVHKRTSSSGGLATQYPREKCQICTKEFTGRSVILVQLFHPFNYLIAVSRYGKGNLSRHIREKHDLVQPLTGKVCRVCDQVYNRADAKRKHEWKKHRLPDARPNKRRKER